MPQVAPRYATAKDAESPMNRQFEFSRGRTVTLKVKFADFEIITRSRSVPSAISTRDDLARLSIGLLENSMPLPKACGSWECRCHPCRARTMQSRNWIS